MHNVTSSPLISSDNNSYHLNPISNSVPQIHTENERNCKSTVEERNNKINSLINNGYLDAPDYTTNNGKEPILINQQRDSKSTKLSEHIGNETNGEIVSGKIDHQPNNHLFGDTEPQNNDLKLSNLNQNDQNSQRPLKTSDDHSQDNNHTSKNGDLKESISRGNIPSRAEFYIGGESIDQISFHSSPSASLSSVIQVANTKSKVSDADENAGDNENDISQIVQPEFYPPDGGYGWIIALSACVVNVFIIGFIRSYGVLYVAIMQRFPEASAYQASWLPVFLSTIGLLIAPITGVLCRRFTSRRVSFFGGVLIFLGMIFGAFARSITGMIFSFGLLTGIGAGLTTIPGVLITSLYFKKRRSVASGICISGNAIGGFIIPPLLEYLLETFQLKGALCIMAALELHICVASLFYRPIAVHALIQQRKSKHMYFPKEEDSSIYEEFPAQPEIPSKLKFSFKKSKDFQSQVSFLRSSSLLNAIPDLNEYAKSWSVDKPNTRTQDFFQTYFQEKINWSTVPKDSDIKQNLESSKSFNKSVERNRSIRRYSFPRNTFSLRLKISKTPRKGTDDKEISNSKDFFTKESKKIEERLDSSNTKTESDDLLTEEPLNLEVVKEDPQSTSCCGKYFDCSLLSNTLFWLVAISVTFIGSGAPHAMFFVPAFATSVNIEKSSIIYLMSVTSIIDLFARLGIGFLSDTNILHSGYIYSISSISAGVALLILPSLTNPIGVGVLLGVYGFGIGGWFVMIPTLLAENHGSQKLAASYGLVRMFNGFMNFVSPQICGAIIDINGDYSGVYYFMGVFMTAGGLIMLAEPHISSKNCEKTQSIEEVPA